MVKSDFLLEQFPLLQNDKMTLFEVQRKKVQTAESFDFDSNVSEYHFYDGKCAACSFLFILF